MDEEELREELKQSIEDNSLEFWLLQIGQICRERAEDLRFDYDDAETADAWDKAARAVERFAVTSPISEIS